MLKSVLRLLRGKPVVVSALLGLTAFCVYLRTLAPSIVFGDSPELTTAAYQLGVAHPTGYPLYMLVGHAFIRFLPFGDPAHRMNLLSAVAASIAVGLTYLLALRFTRKRVIATVVALLLAFSDTFWSRAVIAEAYTLHLAFVAGVLLCVVSWDRTGDKRWLRAGAVVLGLSLTHHMQTTLLFPALAYFVLTSKRRSEFFRELRWTVPLAAAPLLLWLYIPWAAWRDPPMNWGDCRTWHNFWIHVTGGQYTHLMKVSSASLHHHLLQYFGRPVEDVNPGFLQSQFSVALLWLAPVGLWELWRRRRRLFGVTVLFYLAVVAWALCYEIYNVEVYYIPSHLMVALWIGCGMRRLVFWLRRTFRRMRVPRQSRARIVLVFSATLALLPVLLALSNFRAQDRSRDQSALGLGHALLDAVKPDAIMITGGDNWAFPPAYAHYVEGRRRDVLLVPFIAATVPSQVRLITRLEHEGLIVRIPPGYGRTPSFISVPGLLKNLVADNRHYRPVYIADTTWTKLRQFAVWRDAVPGIRNAAAHEALYEVPGELSQAEPRAVIKTGSLVQRAQP